MLIFFLGASVISCRDKKTEAANDKPEPEAETITLTEGQLKTANVILAKVAMRTLSGVLKVSGKLDVPPQNIVSIAAPFGGFLVSTEMLQGKPVKKGQRIAVIQNPEYIQLQQDYIDNKSQLEYLAAEFERQETLAKENINAQKSLQQAKALYFSKVAIVNGLRAKLKLLHIDFAALERGEIVSSISLTSPINGFITEVNFNIGTFLSPTDILFRIVDTSHLHAELTVFEQDAVKIKEGQKVRFMLSGSGEERLATVYLIGREISTDRTVRIHSHLDKEETNLLPGMYLNAVIELESTPVKTLPEDAVVSFEGRQYVFVPGANRSEFKKVEVTTGIKEFGYVQIDFLENLADSSTIVVGGAYSLLSKMKNSDEE